MDKVISSKPDELIRCCEKHGVFRLEVFGSAIRDDFNEETSDLDFLVEFAPCTPAEHYEHYFGLIEELEYFLARKVDLIESGAVRNPYFREEISRTRERVYAA